MGIPGIIVLVLLGGGILVMILGWLWIAISHALGGGGGSGDKSHTRHSGGRRRRKRYLRKFLAHVL